MGPHKYLMEIPLDVATIYQPTHKQGNSSSPQDSLEHFLAHYKEVMGAPITFLLADGALETIVPTEEWVTKRTSFVQQMFEQGKTPQKIYETKVHGGFSELVAPIILDTIFRQATHGEVVCIPALPQLDMERNKNQVRSPDDPGKMIDDKSADVIIGQVVEISPGVRAIQPLMMFDVKAAAREKKEGAQVGIGYNVRLGEAIPVGILYAGDLRFSDTMGTRRCAKEYFLQVVRHAVRRGHIPWQVSWPVGNKGGKNELLKTMIDELSLSCYYTQQRISGKGYMLKEQKKRLLENIAIIQMILDFYNHDAQNRIDTLAS